MDNPYTQQKFDLHKELEEAKEHNPVLQNMRITVISIFERFLDDPLEIHLAARCCNAMEIYSNEVNDYKRVLIVRKNKEALDAIDKLF